MATYDEAVESRFAHWGEGKKISLPGPVKRLISSDFPEFALKTGRGLWFLKPITGELALHLVFDNDCLGRIGKAFTIQVGLEGTSGPLDGVCWRESLFRVFGVDGLQPCWTFQTADELAVALCGLAFFLRAVLAPLESHCRHFLDPLPDMNTLSSEIVRRGPITAREAWPEAIAEARAWSSDASLFRLDSGYAPQSCPMLGPNIGPDGHLRPHGHWSFLFRSAEKRNEILHVMVPSLGTVRSSLSPPNPSTDPPVGDDWFDSDRLLASFKEIWKAAAPDQPVDHADFLRCELRTGASPIGIEQRGSALTPGKPEPPASNRWWTVECRTKSRGRHLAHTARFDAVSGGHIHVLKETH